MHIAQRTQCQPSPHVCDDYLLVVPFELANFLMMPQIYFSCRQKVAEQIFGLGCSFLSRSGGGKKLTLFWGGLAFRYLSQCEKFTNFIGKSLLLWALFKKYEKCSFSNYSNEIESFYFKTHVCKFSHCPKQCDDIHKLSYTEMQFQRLFFRRCKASTPPWRRISQDGKALAEKAFFWGAETAQFQEWEKNGEAAAESKLAGKEFVWWVEQEEPGGRWHKTAAAPSSLDDPLCRETHFDGYPNQSEGVGFALAGNILSDKLQTATAHVCCLTRQYARWLLEKKLCMWSDSFDCFWIGLMFSFKLWGKWTPGSSWRKLPRVLWIFPPCVAYYSLNPKYNFWFIP